MTKRPRFVIGEDNLIYEPLIEFQWVGGFSAPLGQNSGHINTEGDKNENQ